MRYRNAKSIKQVPTTPPTTPPIILLTWLRGNSSREADGASDPTGSGAELAAGTNRVVV